ncbi:MAG: hypothetical protein ACKV1O_14125 [Saprospiraceae bacterium]
MATTNSRNLELITNGDDVTIQVTYNVVFTQLEHHLASNGLRFAEYIRVIGEDSGTSSDRTLRNFTPMWIPVTSEPAGQTIERSRAITVPRTSLWEDNDNVSEIRCRIQIVPLGFPTTITGYTDQEEIDILGFGDIN